MRGDYFGFYRTLGKPVVLVARNARERSITRVSENESTEQRYHCKRDEIAGIGCGVLRKMAQPRGGTKAVWYICDVKVGRKYRGDHIPYRMLRRELWRAIRCNSGYFISMDPAGGETPYAARLWAKNTVFGASSRAQRLKIYSLSAEVLRKNRGRMEEICGGRIYFKSMRGKKDFEIFTREGKCARDWDLLHVQHGIHGDKEVSACTYAEPQEGHDHLIAAFCESGLDRGLSEVEGISLFGSATLVYYNLDPSMFCDTIMTNEI